MAAKEEHNRQQEMPNQAEVNEAANEAMNETADVQQGSQPDAEFASEAQEAAADVPGEGAPSDANEKESPVSNETDQAQLEELRKQIEELQNRLLRVQADYDNFRRRTRQEKEDLHKYAAADVIENLLPVLDNFDRALVTAEGGNDYDALLKGIDMIFRQFRQVLEQLGLSAMDAVGQPFNPEFHEAVMKVEDSDQEEGIVLEELQKGYMFKDKVLRPAMVKVSG